MLTETLNLKCSNLSWMRLLFTWKYIDIILFLKKFIFAISSSKQSKNIKKN
jgi:hypothetical protein